MHTFCIDAVAYLSHELSYLMVLYVVQTAVENFCK